MPIRNSSCQYYDLFKAIDTDAEAFQQTVEADGRTVRLF